MPKRTFNPSKVKRARRFGYRAVAGKKGIIENRRRKGRQNLSASHEFGTTATAKNKRLRRRR